MRSRLYALGTLLATAAWAATGQCDEITPSAIPLGHPATESTAVGNHSWQGEGLGRSDAAIAVDAFLSAACVLSRVLA
jgi:hypothetical protein